MHCEQPDLPAQQPITKMPQRCANTLGPGRTGLEFDMSNRTCTFKGCEREHRARGWCSTHYKQVVTNGGTPKTPVVKRPGIYGGFWGKVQKSTGDKCWAWIGATRNGYGVINREGFVKYAHRISYEVHKGELPEAMKVDHICWNRACVNPDHLRISTTSQNGQNREGLNANNKSGYRGVFWEKRYKLWCARAKVNNRATHIGYFKEKADAIEAARKWRKENMPYSILDQVA